MRSDLTGDRNDALDEGSFQEPDQHEDPRFEELIAEKRLREEFLGTGEREDRRPSWALVCAVQGAYYLGTGLWPLLHMRSFELVTGPKTDRWLVRTVGALVASTGAGLLQAGLRGQVPPSLRTISLLSAAGLIAVELPTARRGRISPVYLLDALLEAGFAVAMLLPAGRRTRGAPFKRHTR